MIDNHLLLGLKKYSVALLYGGASPEHEVSISSSKGVYPLLKNLTKSVYLIGISKNNEFYLQNENDFLYEITNNIKPINKLEIIPNKGFSLNGKILNIDIAFPVTHGCYGEDGRLQGLLSYINIKTCGCDNVASAICMSKAHCSSILKDHDIKTTESIVFDIFNNYTYKEVVKKFGTKLFIKSETTGSSVGVHAIKKKIDEIEFQEIIKESFKYSNRVLVQPLYDCMEEIECAALEHEGKIIIGGPGIVVKPGEDTILSYDLKYAKENGATMNTNPNLNEKVKENIRYIAKRIFKILNLKSYARIDFFYFKDGTLLLNEVNTLPGLTSVSHYPLLIKSIGISEEEAIAIILDGAINGRR
ncbi:MAG: hypothetical protein JJE21_05400 [Spirochaetaceae bacterium]|nr:hypothetical protein [Spirochaetaceae bacterium]